MKLGWDQRPCPSCRRASLASSTRNIHDALPSEPREAAAAQKCLTLRRSCFSLFCKFCSVPPHPGEPCSELLTLQRERKLCSPHHKPAGKGQKNLLLCVSTGWCLCFSLFSSEKGSAEPCGSPQELSSQLCNSLWRGKGIPEEEGKTGLHSVPKRRQLIRHGCSALKAGQSLLWSCSSSFPKQQGRPWP